MTFEELATLHELEGRRTKPPGLDTHRPEPAEDDAMGILEAVIAAPPVAGALACGAEPAAPVDSLAAASNMGQRSASLRNEWNDFLRKGAWFQIVAGRLVGRASKELGQGGVPHLPAEGGTGCAAG